MEAYAKALLIAIPFFIGLVLLEVFYGYIKGDQKHYILDTISSISSGVTNIIRNILGLYVVVFSYDFILVKFGVVQLESTAMIYIIGFVVLDLASYWNHRLSHKINFFWNQHVIHHSSEEFNLACALRQPISNLLGYFPLFLFPAAMMGVPSKVIATLAPIHLFAQFWYHTQHIGKLGWIEYVLVTPSQHRVHHAINPTYIDKNLAAIFSIWDRLFGTFQEELDDVPPVYGILKPARTWNPFLINFQHIWRLIQDAWRTNDWKAKFLIWFMPTGWRPEDVKEKYPIEVVEDVYNMEKYKHEESDTFIAYVLFQFLMISYLLLFMFFHFEHLTYPNFVAYGMFVLVSVFGFTSLMDRMKFAKPFEICRGSLGIILVWFEKDYFGFELTWPSMVYVFTFYFLAVIIGSLIFSSNRLGKEFKVSKT